MIASVRVPAIPDDASGELRVDARAYLLRYPTKLVDDLGQEGVPPLSIASSSTVLKVADGRETPEPGT